MIESNNRDFAGGVQQSQEFQEKFIEITKDNRINWSRNNNLLFHRYTNYYAHIFINMISELEAVVQNSSKEAALKEIESIESELMNLIGKSESYAKKHGNEDLLMWIRGW